jgi:hypothetical protein
MASWRDMRCCVWCCGVIIGFSSKCEQLYCIFARCFQVISSLAAAFCDFSLLTGFLFGGVSHKIR